MSRSTPHPSLAVLLALAICTLWAVPSQFLYLRLLRESDRFGETVGITSTAASGAGSLGGQILGFNYSRPPAWYVFAAGASSRAMAIAPGLIVALWLNRRRSSGRRFLPTTPLRIVSRAALAIMAAGVIHAAFDQFLSTWLWLRLIDLGESLGGTVYRMSGALAIGVNGPFMGGSSIDGLANLLARYGPVVCFATLASAAAIVLHTLLWRADRRAAETGRLCPQCGYDLRATPASSPCPECGRANASATPTR
jgi:hypothetical protein